MLHAAGPRPLSTRRMPARLVLRTRGGGAAACTQRGKKLVTDAKLTTSTTAALALLPEAAQAELLACALQATGDPTALLNAAFDEMDALDSKKDDAVALGSLSQALTDGFAHPMMAHEAFPALLSLCDANGDGILTRDEWVSGMLGQKLPNLEREVKQLLQILRGAKLAKEIDAKHQ